MTDEKVEELKVSEEVLKQINFRKACLASANGLFQMAQRELNLYAVEQLKELDLDTTKNYNIDDKTGIVSEVKSEPVKKEVKEVAKTS